MILHNLDDIRYADDFENEISGNSVDKVVNLMGKELKIYYKKQNI